MCFSKKVPALFAIGNLVGAELPIVIAVLGSFAVIAGIPLRDSRLEPAAESYPWRTRGTPNRTITGGANRVSMELGTAAKGNGGPVLSGHQVEDFFSRSSKWYDLFHQMLFLGSLPEYRRFAAEQIRVAGPGRCLDVASGTGENALAFAHTHPDFRVVAVDISRDMLRVNHSKRKGERIDYVQASVDHLPFRDQVFELSMDSWGFNLLSGERAWPEVLRVTRPGGKIVDIDILHVFWDYWFLNPVVRPFILWGKILARREPLLIPRKDFFVRLGLDGVRQQRTRKPLAVVQVVSGTRP